MAPMNSNGPKRLFRQKHPIIVGFFILGLVMFMYWGGITFFLSRTSHPSTEIFGPREGVGILELKNIIINADPWIKQLREFRKNEKVKAVVIRIDSPGGAVGASQELYEEIRRTNEKKPVVASMASIAASGGYYAALGASRIMANAGTMTGSIGVIIKLANFKELFEKIGYQNNVIKSGKLKDIGSLDRELTEEERSSLQAVVDDVHQQFITTIAERRALALEKVRALADGRVYSGLQAKEHGLIDEIGNFTDAVSMAAHLAGMKEEEPPLIYPPEESFPLVKLLTGETEKALFQRLIDVHPTLSYEWAVK